MQAYTRYHLVQACAARSHLAPSIEEVMGDREQMGPDDGSLHRRNEALRVAGLSLHWQQFLDEAAWLRAHTLEWIDRLGQEELNEQVGWVEFWNGDVPRPTTCPST